MCGIAGFSLRANSTVNARELAHALLSGIESRGSHASGFAFAANKRLGIYKDAVRGSQLPLRTLARDAKTVILHTRFATHGPESENENNHPVMSPDGSIALTHNGVISNHESVRTQLGKLAEDIPEVDTGVIPALLQDGNFRDFRKLAGYAAVAWLVKGESDILHLGRLKTSPVVWTMLHDGSFVYASTEPILRGALRAAGLWHGGVMALAEHDYFQITNGVIVASDTLPSMTYESYNSHARYSAATSGQGSRVTPSTSRTPVPAVKTEPPKAVSPAKFVAGVKSSDGAPQVEVTPTTPIPITSAPSKRIGDSFGERAWTEIDDMDDAEIDEAVRKFHAQLESKGISAGSMTDEEWANYGDNYGGTPAVLFSGSENDVSPEDDDATFPGSELFYTIDNRGTQTGYTSLDALETELIWHAGLHIPEEDDLFKAVGKTKWVEHFVDVGEIMPDGEMKSWVDNSERTLVYDKDSNHDMGLEYVRHGIDLLIPHRRQPKH